MQFGFAACEWMRESYRSFFSVIIMKNVDWVLNYSLYFFKYWTYTQLYVCNVFHLSIGADDRNIQQSIIALGFGLVPN